MVFIADNIKRTLRKPKADTEYRNLLTDAFRIIAYSFKGSDRLLNILNAEKQCMITEDHSSSPEKSSWFLDFHFLESEETKNFDSSITLSASELLKLQTFGYKRPFWEYNEASSSLNITNVCKGEQKRLSCLFKWIEKCFISVNEETRILNYTENRLHVHTQFLKKCHVAISTLDAKDYAMLNIMDEIATKLRSSKVKVMLFPDDKAFIWPPEFCDVLEVGEGSSRWEKRARNTEFSKDSDMAWYTAKSDTLINMMDNLADPRLDRKKDLKYGLHIRNMISFPIHVRGKVAGAVDVINRKDGPHFTTEDENLCDVIGEYISYIVDYIDNRENLMKSTLKCESEKEMLLYKKRAASLRAAVVR